MRKTALMRLVEKTNPGANLTTSLIPATIDPVVYTLAELGETRWGAEWVELAAQDILMTGCNYSRQKALEFLTDQFFRVRSSDFLPELQAMPPLDQKTYVDYIVMATKLSAKIRRGQDPRQDVFLQNSHHILTAYASENPHKCAELIFDFFNKTNEPIGYYFLVRDLCRKIKLEKRL